MSVTHTTFGAFNAVHRALARNGRFGRLPDLDTTPVILVEGDSWVAMPPYHDLGDHLERLTGGLYLRMGNHGDTAKDMFSGRNLDTLRRRIDQLGFDVAVVSAGGNDLAGVLDRHRVFKPTTPPMAPDQAVGMLVTNGVFDRIATAYRRFLKVTREAGTHVVGHGYAYPRLMGVPLVLTVQNIGLLALFKRTVGDWIQRHIQHVLPTEAEQLAFAEGMIDRFHDHVLAQLDPADFSYVDLRRALPDPADWNDELHPSEAGFGKLARQLKPEIARHLPPAKRANF